jgi:hypothetical protein
LGSIFDRSEKPRLNIVIKKLFCNPTENPLCINDLESRWKCMQRPWFVFGDYNRFCENAPSFAISPPGIYQINIKGIFSKEEFLDMVRVVDREMKRKKQERT